MRKIRQFYFMQLSAHMASAIFSPQKNKGLAAVPCKSWLGRNSLELQPCNALAPCESVGMRSFRTFCPEAPRNRLRHAAFFRDILRSNSR